MSQSEAWLIVGASIWGVAKYILPPVFWIMVGILLHDVDESAPVAFPILIVALIVTYWSYL